MIKLESSASLSIEAFKAIEESLAHGFAEVDGYRLTYEVQEANHFKIEPPVEWERCSLGSDSSKQIAQFKVFEIFKDPSGINKYRPLIFQVEQIHSDSNEIHIGIFDETGQINVDNIVINSTSSFPEIFERRLACSIQEIKIERFLNDNKSIASVYEGTYKFSAAFDFLLRYFHRDDRVVQLDPKLIRSILEQSFDEFKQTIQLNADDSGLEDKQDIVRMISSYVGDLERFSRKRPIQLLMHDLVFIGGNLRRLADLLITDVAPHGDRETKDATQVYNKVSAIELVGDLHLGRFSAVSEYLTRTSSGESVSKDKILSVLHSPVLNVEPVRYLSRLGEAYIHEVNGVVDEYAKFLSGIINRNVDGAFIDDDKIIEAIRVYAELLDEYQSWWRMSSRFDIPKSGPTPEFSELDGAFQGSFISERTLKSWMNQEDLNNVELFVAQISKIKGIVKERNEQFGLVSPIKIASYSIDSIPPYDGLIDVIDTLERQNLITPDLPFGFSHPTGIEWINCLVQKHHATVVTATINGELGGHCIAVTEESKMPKKYLERIEDVKRLGMVPKEAQSAYVEVILVDGIIRPQFKEEERRGFVELFGKQIREITGTLWKQYFSDKEEDEEGINDLKVIPEVWLVAMVGVENMASRLYESDGWIINRSEEAIVTEHGSKYFQMCKRVI